MGHFWGKYLATFYFNIWSHLVGLDLTRRSFEYLTSC